MPTLWENLERRLFWIVAHVCFRLYRAFPVFGSLRASVAIIHRDQKFLVIQRNDGRGLSLPGGIASWREIEEATLQREVREESGLEIMSSSVKMRYHTAADVPCWVTVFDVSACGKLQGSWEGSPRWMTLDEIEPQLIESQRPVLETMKKTTEGTV